MTAETLEAPVAEPIPERSDAHKTARNVALRYSGHEAAMLGEAVRAKRMAEKLQKFAATSEPKDLEFSAEEEAAMAVNLGNETHYHVQSTMPTNPSSTPPAQPNGLRRFVWPALLGALLPVLGAGGMALYSYLTDKPESVTTITNPENELNTRFGIHVYQGPPP